MPNTRTTQYENEAEGDVMPQDNLEMLRLQLELEKVRDATRQKELKMMEIENERLKIERERQKELGERGISTSNNQTNDMFSPACYEKIQIPFISDNSDPTSILTNFERLCKNYGIPESRWVSRLLPFLGGRASGACARINEEEANDYFKVKDKILEEFRVTAEKCRRNFREMQKKQGESFMQLGIRMKEAFSRWVSGVNVEKTYKGLEDLMLREQFQNTLNSELSIFVSDREPQNFDEMLKIAERFEESRERCRSNITRKFVPSFPRKQFTPRENANQRFEKPVVTCYSCQKIGHYSRDCPNNKNKISVETRPKNSYFIGMSSDELKSPYERKMVINGKSRTGIRDTGASITVVNEDIVLKHQFTGKNVEITTISGEIRNLPMAEIDIFRHGRLSTLNVAVARNVPFEFLLGNDHGEVLQIVLETTEVPKTTEFNGSFYVNQLEQYTYGSIVNGKYVRTLRDSASEVNLVRPEIVEQGQYTGIDETIRTVTGKIISLPTAYITLEDSLGKRNITACVNKYQPVPLIVGNKDGGSLRPISQILMVQTRAKSKQLQSNTENLSAEGANAKDRSVPGGTETEAVNERETRCLAHHCEERPMGVKETEGVCEGELSGGKDFEGDNCGHLGALYCIGGKEEFVAAQLEDTGLKGIFGKVSEDFVDCEGGKAIFRITDGVLKREWISRKSGEKWVQMVVPAKLRQSIMAVAHDSRLAAHLGVKKMRDRILKNFYWPGILSDVGKFVNACRYCQRSHRQKTQFKAELNLFRQLQKR